MFNAEEDYKLVFGEAIEYLFVILEELINYSDEKCLDFSNDRIDLFRLQFDYDILKAGENIAREVNFPYKLTKARLINLFAVKTLGQLNMKLDDFYVYDINIGDINIGCNIRFDFWLKNNNNNDNLIVSVARLKYGSWKVYQTTRFLELSNLGYVQRRWVKKVFITNKKERIKNLQREEKIKYKSKDIVCDIEEIKKVIKLLISNSVKIFKDRGKPINAVTKAVFEKYIAKDLEKEVRGIAKKGKKKKALKEELLLLYFAGRIIYDEYTSKDDIRIKEYKKRENCNENYKKIYDLWLEEKKRKINYIYTFALTKDNIWKLINSINFYTIKELNKKQSKQFKEMFLTNELKEQEFKYAEKEKNIIAKVKNGKKIVEPEKKKTYKISIPFVIVTSIILILLIRLYIFLCVGVSKEIYAEEKKSEIAKPVKIEKQIPYEPLRKELTDSDLNYFIKKFEKDSYIDEIRAKEFIKNKRYKYIMDKSVRIDRPNEKFTDKEIIEVAQYMRRDLSKIIKFAKEKTPPTRESAEDYLNTFYWPKDVLFQNVKNNLNSYRRSTLDERIKNIYFNDYELAKIHAISTIGNLIPDLTDSDFRIVSAKKRSFYRNGRKNDIIVFLLKNEKLPQDVYIWFMHKSSEKSWKTFETIRYDSSYSYGFNMLDVYSRDLIKEEFGNLLGLN